MRMDENLENKRDESPPSARENDGHRNVVDVVDDLLEQLTGRLTNGVSGSHSSHSEATSHTTNSNISDITVEGIDPSSPLGISLQSKFSELEEISRRLKSRLDRVVCDTDIILSPDGDQSLGDFDLERDLNTDSQAEDLTPQEFFQLIQSQVPGSSKAADGPCE